MTEDEDLRSPNPFAAPVVRDVMGAARPTHGIIFAGGLIATLVVFEAVMVYVSLVPRPRMSSTVALVIAAIAPLVAAGYCGNRRGFRQSLVPLVIGNFAAWCAFVGTILLLHAKGQTSVNINSSDLYCFAAIAVGSAILVVIVAAIASSIVRHHVDRPVEAR